MDVFDLRTRLVNDYARYTRSFIKIADPRINERVEGALNDGVLWPKPLLQLNPTFLLGGTVDDLFADGTLHDECVTIFRINKSDSDHSGKQFLLHAHQTEAIRKAREGKSYVLTSGTGSGKSLAYIIPIVDHVLRNGSGQGVQAIVVYPMNALANSQHEELSKFINVGYPPGAAPVTFARYTGQERGPERDAIRSNPPDILLTNYMMLELLLTRHDDRELVRKLRGVRFLVFDELHTYRGRQGADVAMLIRRCRQSFGDEHTVCVGTSATMASGGSTEDQRREVASVAQTFFGVPFDSSQVIGETLERVTPERDKEDTVFHDELRKALSSGPTPPDGYESFCSHPLSSWIETTFGVTAEVVTGRLIRQLPQRLEGPGSAAEELARQTGLSEEACSEHLHAFLMKGVSIRRSESSRFPVFAFRLHQFFTRGDTVWSTLEAEAVRHIELSKQVAKPGEPEKPMFGLVFCRQCGAAYYRIRDAHEHGKRVLLPRDDRREEGDDGSGDGYLFLSEEHPWPLGGSGEELSRLPSFMKELNAKGVEKVKSDSKKLTPQTVFVTAGGEVVSEGKGLRAALVLGDFRFCLAPGCGVAYSGQQRSERGKLATLGVDNRSTATTILAVRALIEMQSNQNLDKEARKLLSFTDNRQDASLQAGHFNDFAQVALLRSALHKATELRGDAGLRHGELSKAVFEAMALRFEEYAADADIVGPGRSSTHDALRRVIEYYLYRDLQRGWRVTAPNLEDCGLLAFDYVGLMGAESLLAETDLWTRGFEVRGPGDSVELVTVPEALRSSPDELREQVLRTLLDVLRKSLALKVDTLDPNKQLDLVEQTKPRLLEDTVWYLEDTRELVRAEVAYPRPKGSNERNGLFVSSFGGFGRYLKRTLAKHLPSGTPWGREEVDEAIRFLFRALKRYGILEQVRGGDVPGYQINPEALIWKPSDGTVRPIDRTRLLEAGEELPEVNQYFLQCYKKFVDLKCVLEAREHTAQVASEDREEREQRFRTGNLPLLFCSPTMELGVDIAQLNVVNLRNVPPTPANYAQRSGRAGRGGQQALVYTYCAGRSPHDQYYFREPEKLVAGAVAAPRIDLRNRDLIRSHLHAVWMEVAKPDLGKTLASVLDLTPDGSKLQLPLKPAVAATLRDLAKRGQALQRCARLVESIQTELGATSWYHDNWTREVLDQIERSFDSACERWRSLYRAAFRQRELHHRIILDQSRNVYEKKQSSRLRAQAESQVKLLTEAEGIFEGDFYSYRYFAAEGFLPGYNFPRLPLSAYVPGRGRRKGRDEFVSRPRFLAISEFGPRALVYHEGGRYRVYKVNLDFSTDDIEATHELPTATMKRCVKCGYAHVEEGTQLAEVCDRCGDALDVPARIDQLVHLQNVSLKLAQRITCDEEERQRFGYNIKTAYRFPQVGGAQDRKDADVFVDGTKAMRLSYGDATALYRINLGWLQQAATTPRGFNLDLERGYWSRNQADTQDSDDAENQGRIQRVVPYVTDTKNALVMELHPWPGQAEMAGLQAAFKEAIQKHFQIEPRELFAEAMPAFRDRRQILFYEASEGGAGVLRQVVDDPAVLPLLARKALEICHYDPDTLVDLQQDSCGKACYECLLDYGNQGDHRELDRTLIRPLLAGFMRGECKPAGGMGSRAERMAALRARCDSGLEKKWLGLLDELRLNPPSHAQYRIPTYYTQPDFFYSEHNAAIYVDGPPHDQPEQVREDERITSDLMQRGYIVIRFHHGSDWNAIFRRHPDVFGTPRA